MVTAKVDLSSLFGSARDQGKRPTCLAFATSDANTFSQTAPTGFLSSEFLFYYAAQEMPPNAHHFGCSRTAIAAALTKEGQPIERHYPYQRHLDRIAPLPVPQTPFPKRTYKNIARFFTGTAQDALNLLDAKKVAILLVKITNQFRYLKGPSFTIDVISNDIEVGRHAVVAVGHGIDSDGHRYLRIRNSWGSRWGDQGYAWLREDYVDKQICGYGLVS